jgi:hypothetical protein
LTPLLLSCRSDLRLIPAKTSFGQAWLAALGLKLDVIWLTKHSVTNYD